MKCPTCGKDEQLHDEFLLAAHEKMHEAMRLLYEAEELTRKSLAVKNIQLKVAKEYLKNFKLGER